MTVVELDFDSCYRAVSARDPRFDGRFYTAVTSTGIYCRPICPARTPAPRNVRFYRHAASAEAAGFRPCKRCRPEISPGDPGWDHRGDVIGRALRLIDEGVADDHGVAGLARRLHLTERHLHRLFTTELGVAPLAVARTRRLLLAKQLLTETSLPVTDVAFAAGFGSLRQFNATMKETYGFTPSELRATAGPFARSRPRMLPAQPHGTDPQSGPGVQISPAVGNTRPVQHGLAGKSGTVAPKGTAIRGGTAAEGDAALHATVADHGGRGIQSGAAAGAVLALRLNRREPFDAGALLRFLAARAIPGLESADEHHYGRAVPGGLLTLTPVADHVRLEVHLADTRQLARIVSRCRRLLDLDADPAAVAAALCETSLAPLVAARPGLRVPGAFCGFELAVRAVVGQQVTVAGARTLLGRIVARAGEPATATGPGTATGPDTPARSGNATGMGDTMGTANGGPSGSTVGSGSSAGPANGGVAGSAGAAGADGAVAASMTALFPTPERLAEADLGGLGLTGRRIATLKALAERVASGETALDGGQDPAEVVAELRTIPGIGPWTTGYIAMRALRDPDAWPESDLALRKAMACLGIPAEHTDRWRPWRAYAALHLWHA